MDIDVSNFFSEDDCKSFTSKSDKIDKTGRFYHVTQQAYNRNYYFNLSVAKYRDHLLKQLCEKYKVIPLCNIIMPTHTHDLFLCQNYYDIEKVMQSLNTRVSKFVKKEREKDGKTLKDPVFDATPAYERIENLGHLFYLFKYFYDNPQYLKEQKQFIPYSSFEMWEKGYYKHYKEELYIKLFAKSLEEICKNCRQLDKNEFRKLANELYGKIKI